MRWTGTLHTYTGRVGGGGTIIQQKWSHFIKFLPYLLSQTDQVVHNVGLELEIKYVLHFLTKKLHWTLYSK